MIQKSSPRLLKLVDYPSLILRQKTKPLAFPLSDEDKQTINDMKYSIQSKQLLAANAPWENAVGMAANQWGIDKQIFLYCPTGDTENNLEVIINPSYEHIHPQNSDPKQDMETEWEACFSVPLATGNVQRFIHIRVTYQNESGETIVRELEGWPARVWQHENDHLLGHLYDDPRTGKCIDKRTFSNREAVDEFYDEIREMRKNKLDDAL